MGRDLAGWVDYDFEFQGLVHAFTLAQVTFDRDDVMFDLLASAGRTPTVAEAIEKARGVDPEGVNAHLAANPPLTPLVPMGLPPRLGHGPEHELWELGFVRPEGSVLSHNFGKPRGCDAYRIDERPVYMWPPRDPAYSHYSWLSHQEVEAVAERYAAIPYVWLGKVVYHRCNAQIAAVAAMMAELDRCYDTSRFVFWFED